PPPGGDRQHPRTRTTAPRGLEGRRPIVPGRRALRIGQLLGGSRADDGRVRPDLAHPRRGRLRARSNLNPHRALPSATTPPRSGGGPRGPADRAQNFGPTPSVGSGRGAPAWKTSP